MYNALMSYAKSQIDSTVIEHRMLAWLHGAYAMKQQTRRATKYYGVAIADLHGSGGIAALDSANNKFCGEAERE